MKGERNALIGERNSKIDERNSVSSDREQTKCKTVSKQLSDIPKNVPLRLC
jgi:hypothetical protein